MNSIISTYFINIGGRREEGIHKVGKNTLRKLIARCFFHPQNIVEFLQNAI